MSRNRNTAPAGSLQAVFGSLFAVGFTAFWTYGVYSQEGPFIIKAIMMSGGVFCFAVSVAGFVDSLKKYRKRKQDQAFWGDTGSMYGEMYGEERYSAGHTAGNNPVFSGKLGEIYQYTDAEGNIYCPYCGVKIAHDFEFCPKCGRKLPF